MDRGAWWVAVVLAIASMAATAGADTRVSGVVFEDSNGNGLRDARESGIAGVALSNGRDIVRSTANGSYSIAVQAGDVVFAIKPADRGFGLREDGLPHFWQAAGRPRFDVPLSATRVAPESMQVVLLTDPQPKSVVDVDYYRRDIVAPLRGTPARLGLTLGDIVNDDVSLYPAMNAVTASLGLPWLHVAGNHDLDAAAASDADSLRSFRASYGPDTVAWEEVGATFIGLDDVVVLPGQRPAYIGGLREDQFAFLAAYLPSLPRDRLLVLGAHIPFFNTAAPGVPPTFRPADRERLFALLRDFPRVLLLSGHTHNQQHVLHGPSDGWHGALPLHEYNLGAACGAFWSGIKDADGIPDTMMSDGTPNGYAVLTLLPQGAYALAWHNARDLQDTQIGLSAPKVLRRGAYPAWAVYANVYMGFEAPGMDQAPVQYRIDAGPWAPMRKVLQPDPRLLAENVRDDAAQALRGYDRSPEATRSAHLWRGTLPTDLAEGSHAVEVRYLDPWRGEQRASTDYRLVDANP